MLVTFNSELSICETYHKDDYDRTPIRIPYTDSVVNNLQYMFSLVTSQYSMKSIETFGLENLYSYIIFSKQLKLRQKLKTLST